MIKVVSFKICPFVQRVTAALEAKKIPYEVEYISLGNPPAWFKDVSPNAQVPLMITESGITLFESDAIIEYLDDRYDALNPELTVEQRAIDRAWSYQATKHYLVQCGAMTSADKETLKDRADKLSKAFARVEKVIGDGTYYRGETIGNVDVVWLPLLHRANIIEQRTGYDFIEKYPKVKSWQDALMQTGLAEKSVPEDFNEAFSGFYLSDKTYLGKSENCSTVSNDSCANGSCECG